MNVAGCLACDVLSGRVEVPGGTIAETEHWHADHCLGPFGVGAVVVKSKEHVEALWRLSDPAAEELGPFLRTISAAIVDGLGAERAYLTMWVDKPPLHVHLVLYPRWPDEEKRGWDVDRERWAAGPRPRRRQPRQPSVFVPSCASLNTALLRFRRWIRSTSVTPPRTPAGRPGCSAISSGPGSSSRRARLRATGSTACAS